VLVLGKRPQEFGLGFRHWRRYRARLANWPPKARYALNVRRLDEPVMPASGFWVRCDLIPGVEDADPATSDGYLNTLAD
jgi:hypothetical protein